MNSPSETKAADAVPQAAELTPETGANVGKHRSRWLLLALAALVLASGAYVALHKGAPGGALPQGGEGTTASSEGGSNKSLKALSDEQLERAVAQAAALTQKDPKNASAWGMLAHSQEMLGKFAEAAQSYKQLAQLLPKDAQVLADYADVLAVAQGRSFKGEPLALLTKALQLDPNNAKALVLQGSAAVDEKDYAQGIAFFERARAAAKDPALQAQVDASIAQAKVLSGEVAAVPVAAAPSAPAKAHVAGAAGQISGLLSLASSLRGKAPDSATLFLYARPVEGSRMPVALLRKKLSDLPLNFTLDDSMAMVSTTSLSQQSKVVVVARVSLRGNVTPAPGDLEGVSAPVAVGTKDLKLEITEVLK